MLDIEYMDTDLPFFTIGIASYNYANYLEKAFNAIKNQNFKNFEVLYCDDGSTDNSVELINNFIVDNPDMQIRLICGKNLGVMGNKNRILEHARGKYLMICDADDYMLDNCLDILFQKAIETQADQVVGSFEQTDAKGNILQIQENPDYLSRWTWGAHHATIYKIEIIRRNNICFNRDFYPDDMYFNMIFHDKSSSFAFVKDVIYNWNMHSDSTSAVKGKTDKWHGILLLKSCISYIKPISDKYKGNELLQIEYCAIKMYCLANFFRYSRNYKAFIEEYIQMKNMMVRNFPQYLNNPYAKNINAKGIVRKPTAKAIWLFTWAEKYHVILLLLSVYWLVSKCKRFVV